MHFVGKISQYFVAVLPEQNGMFVFVLSRGFTGHEHLIEFGLINMNARVYDPEIAAFLSPDNAITYPDNPQNYNRYSYALNNPLKYTDPSENNPLLMLMIGISFAQTITNGVDTYQKYGGYAFEKYLKITAAIAVVNYITGSVTNALFSSLPGLVSNILSSLISGAATSLMTSGKYSMKQAVSSIGSTLLNTAIINSMNMALGSSSVNEGAFAIAEEKRKRTPEDMQKAKNYNLQKISRGAQDEALASITYDEYNLKEGLTSGVADIKNITTMIPDDYGLTSDDLLIDRDGIVKAAITKPIDDNSVSIHVSPKSYGKIISDRVHFRAIIGHEIIHANHIYMFGFDKINPNFTEAAAYKYSASVYQIAGHQYNVYYNNTISIATKLRYYNIYNKFFFPCSYNFPQLRR